MTKLIIDAAKLQANYQIIKAGSAVSVIPDLSFNAYGAGDLEIAKRLSDAPIFKVNRLAEALRVRLSASTSEILVCAPYTAKAELEILINYDITASLVSPECVMKLNTAALALDKTARAHIKFDIGAGFTGFAMRDIEAAISALKSSTNISLTGIYADVPANCDRKQASLFHDKFTKILKYFDEARVPYKLAHLTNSLQSQIFPFLKFGAVYADSALLGVNSCPQGGFEGVCKLQSNICDIRWIKAGASVTGDLIRMKHDTYVAAAPVGLADGVLTKSTVCTIGSSPAQIISVGENTTLIDITGINCALGDKVLFDVDPMITDSLVLREYV